MPRAPLLALRLASWPGDRAAAALALRVNGALHALARSGEVPPLAALYAARSGDVDRAVADAFAAADAALAHAVQHPTQTNEVARSGAIMAGLMTATARFDQPVELLELGASAGAQSLNLAHYCLLPRRHLRRRSCVNRAHCAALDGAGAAPPCLAHGRCSRGRSGAARHCRSRGLRKAAILCLGRPRRSHGAAARRDPRRAAASPAGRPRRCCRLARTPGWRAPQQAGVTRAVVHSMLRQYCNAATRARIAAALAHAGARADAARPLLHLA